MIWIIYDIENDKARTKVAKLCKQAGLYRVQLSVFLGEIESNSKDTLELQILELINEEVDKVYMFPMDKDQLQKTVLLGQAFDKMLVSDQINELFF